MNLKSHLFDRVRIKPIAKEAQPVNVPMCQHPGCTEAGDFRAPAGRLREGEYFCFCLDHVRKYNASYNYFSGMSAEDEAHFLRDALVGHRPTWSMGARHAKTFYAGPVKGAGPRAAQSTFRTHFDGSASEPQKPRLGAAALKALDKLGLDETVDAAAIKARYKDLVKRLHPDANAGDRSNEEQLREIIRAYNYLKTVRQV